jgi:hypothetical protein
MPFGVPDKAEKGKKELLENQLYLMLIIPG